MKKQFFKYYGLILMVLLFSQSCLDDADIKVPVGEPFQPGVFVTVDFSSGLLFDVSDLSGSKITGTFDAPSNNVASHTIKVKVSNKDVNSEVVDLLTVTSFPSSFEITPSQIATATGLELDDFISGTNLSFFGESVGTNGELVTINSLDPDLATESGQKQAYTFKARVLCPAFTVDDVAGQYEVIQGSFFAYLGETTYERTVIAGPDDNQITIVGGEWPTITGTTGDTPDDLILTIDLVTGAVTGFNEDGVAIPEGCQGLIENLYLIEGGIIQPCIGYIEVDMNLNPYSANPHKYILQKIN